MRMGSWTTHSFPPSSCMHSSTLGHSRHWSYLGMPQSSQETSEKCWRSLSMPLISWWGWSLIGEKDSNCHRTEGWESYTHTLSTVGWLAVLQTLPIVNDEDSIILSIFMCVHVHAFCTFSVFGNLLSCLHSWVYLLYLLPRSLCYATDILTDSQSNELHLNNSSLIYI